jgi:hypothetical protein
MATTRTLDDLKALIVAGANYRETVEVEYLGQVFPVPIKPLTEDQLTLVMKNVSSGKSTASMVKAIREKTKDTDMSKLTPAQQDEMKEQLASEIMEDTDNLGDIASSAGALYNELCLHGIDDPELVKLLPQFRYGLRQIIGTQIQKISDVPPQVIANFFGAPTDS